MDNDKLKWLGAEARVSVWEKYDDESTVVRICTSWATEKEKLEELERLL